MTQVFINREEEEDKNKTKKGKGMNDLIAQAHQCGLFTFRIHIGRNAGHQGQKINRIEWLKIRSGSNKVKQLGK